MKFKQHVKRDTFLFKIYKIYKYSLYKTINVIISGDPVSLQVRQRHPNIL